MTRVDGDVVLRRRTMFSGTGGRVTATGRRTRMARTLMGGVQAIKRKSPSNTPPKHAGGPARWIAHEAAHGEHLSEREYIGRQHAPGVV